MMQKFDINPDEFDKVYGEGMMDLVFEIMNVLAPLTRRDSWWETNGPYDAIGEVLKRSKAH